MYFDVQYTHSTFVYLLSEHGMYPSNAFIDYPMQHQTSTVDSLMNSSNPCFSSQPFLATFTPNPFPALACHYRVRGYVLFD